MKTILSQKARIDNTTNTTKQFATFYLGERWYGIDVKKVQEVTKSLNINSMRTAPAFIKGLINLRGQIATAIGLSELFGIGANDNSGKMTVVCRVDDVLLSLMVDNIGDVVEVSDQSYESTPQTIPPNIRAFMQGIHKTDSGILSVVSLENILQELDKKCA